MYQAVQFMIDNISGQMGATAIFYHNNETIDPSTGKTTGNKVSEEIQAVLGSFESYQIDGQAITRSDVKATVDANQFSTPPQSDDELEDKLGNHYKVISVQKQLVEHEPVSYTLQLRQ